MSNLLDLLGNWVLHYYGWRYLIIALWLMVQEETALVVSVYLLSNHYLDWSVFFLTLVLTVFVYEMFFYLTGRYMKNTRLGRYVEAKIPRYARLQFQLHKNANFFLFVSRFVVYLNTAVLFLSGWSGISFKKLLRVRVIANIAWYGILITLSYFSLSTANAIIAHQAEVGVALFLILIIAFQIFAKKVLIEESELEEKSEHLGQIIGEDIDSLDKN